MSIDFLGGDYELSLNEEAFCFRAVRERAELLRSAMCDVMTKELIDMALPGFQEGAE